MTEDRNEQGYRILLKRQDGRCAVCAVERSSEVRLVIDHDHGTGLVRGLLCNSCNALEAKSTSVEFETYRTRPPAATMDWLYAIGYPSSPPILSLDDIALWHEWKRIWEGEEEAERFLREATARRERAEIENTPG